MKKVLVVRFSSFGDLVLTTGPLHLLREKNPNLEIHLLTSETGRELYQSNVEVEQIFVVPAGSGFLDVLHVYRKLENYDAVIDWQGSLKSYFLKLFVRGPFFHIEKQSRQRRAFVKSRKFREELKQHVVQKYYNVLQRALELPEAKLEELRPRLFPHGLTFDKREFDFSKCVILHPYASQGNKEWPYFNDLAQQLLNLGYKVAVVGSSTKASPISPHPGILDLSNKTNLGEMASVIASSKALISTDSGPMHVGVAIAKPTVAIFGPTTRELGFYPQFEQTKVVENNHLDCRPCHVHGGQQCPLGHHKCMKELSASMVLESLESLISKA